MAAARTSVRAARAGLVIAALLLRIRVTGWWARRAGLSSARSSSVDQRPEHNVAVAHMRASPPTPAERAISDSGISWFLIISPVTRRHDAKQRRHERATVPEAADRNRRMLDRGTLVGPTIDRRSCPEMQIHSLDCVHHPAGTSTCAHAGRTRFR